MFQCCCLEPQKKLLRNRQATHGPYTSPRPPLSESIPPVPEYNGGRPTGPNMPPEIYSSLVKVLDDGIRNVTDALKSAGMYDETLVVAHSDNGGVGGGNNYPMRGQKQTPWQGGTRVMGLLSGGFIPTHLRGTVSTVTIHVADWFATFSTLVGVDPSNTVTIAGAPRPIDGKCHSSLPAFPTAAEKQLLQRRQHLAAHSARRDHEHAARVPPRHGAQHHRNIVTLSRFVALPVSLQLQS